MQTMLLLHFIVGIDTMKFDSCSFILCQTDSNKKSPRESHCRRNRSCRVPMMCRQRNNYHTPRHSRCTWPHSFWP